MSYQDYLPSTLFGKKHEDEHPLVSLRKQVDSLFDNFGNGFPGEVADLDVRSNLSETEKDYCITAELPGMTQEDVDVSVSGDRIIIKGEKKSETDEKGDEKGREFHRIERRSGSFQRMMTLPFTIDPEAVTAVVKNGVLTVTIAKPPEAVSKTTKIKIAQEE